MPPNGRHSLEGRFSTLRALRGRFGNPHSDPSSKFLSRASAYKSVYVFIPFLLNVGACFFLIFFMGFALWISPALRCRLLRGRVLKNRLSPVGARPNVGKPFPSLSAAFPFPSAVKVAGLGRRSGTPAKKGGRRARFRALFRLLSGRGGSGERDDEGLRIGRCRNAAKRKKKKAARDAREMANGVRDGGGMLENQV
ncbi:hypothetical protein LSM04_007940 [Trypanosoma melophagium]|uniref:uncharacterized protein n=1 Tax=Trypanosoma melophagium TaxID=715481 RepID=UPI00351A94BF|nr:hypothetical protein LSM04_007940 [Trypanosoma melophagium]